MMLEASVCSRHHSRFSECAAHPARKRSAKRCFGCEDTTLLALVFSVFALVPDLAGSLQLSDTARLAARNSLLSDSKILEADNILRADLRVRSARAELRIEYLPKLSLLTDLDDGRRTPTFLHEARAALDYRTPRLVLGLSEHFMYGQQSFVDLVSVANMGSAPGTPPSAAAPTPVLPSSTAAPRFDLIPGAQAVSIAASRTQAVLYYRLSPRWASELRGGYSFYGGRTPNARLVLPRQDELDAGGSLAYSSNEHSRFAATVTASQIWTSLDFQYVVAGLQASWSAELGPRSAVALSAGASRQLTVFPDNTLVEALVPGGSASLTQRVIAGHASYFSFMLRADYAPFVNVLLAKLQNLLSASAAVDYQYRRFTAALGGTFGQTLPASAAEATRTVSGTATLQLGLSDRVRLLTGVQVAQQRIALESAPSHPLWLAYLACTVDLAPFTF
jgi:hypothetical protein